MEPLIYDPSKVDCPEQLSSELEVIIIIIFNISISLFTIKDQKRFTLLYIKKKGKIVNLITGINIQMNKKASDNI